MIARARYTPPRRKVHMPESLSRKQYKTAWDGANTKQIKIKLNIRTDADILDHLEKTENVQGYLKALIREDMKRGGN